jgi:hypothetical protein
LLHSLGRRRSQPTYPWRRGLESILAQSGTHAVSSGCGGGVRLTPPVTGRPMTPAGRSTVGGSFRIVPPAGIPKKLVAGQSAQEA